MDRNVFRDSTLAWSLDHASRNAGAQNNICDLVAIAPCRTKPGAGTIGGCCGRNRVRVNPSMVYARITMTEFSDHTNHLRAGRELTLHPIMVKPIRSTPTKWVLAFQLRTNLSELTEHGYPMGCEGAANIIVFIMAYINRKKMYQDVNYISQILGLDVRREVC